MNYQEAIEIIVNYVEVMDEGDIKTRLCEIINHDFVLDDNDVNFLNKLIEDNTMPLNISIAVQVLMK